MMKCENVEVLPIAKSNSNWKLATLVLATLATMATFAKTFDWRITGNDTQAAQFAAYHGETVRFNLIFSGAASNCTAAAARIYYQTNGMDQAWWPTDGLTFAPTNDMGAATYRFFVRAQDDLGVNYTANGILRMLPSPGFEPSVVELPVKTLDFDLIDVLHAPWATAETDALIASATPEDYDAVRAQVNTNAADIAALETNKADKAELAGYLPLTGGTMTGPLRVESIESDVSVGQRDSGAELTIGHLRHAPGLVRITCYGDIYRIDGDTGESFAHVYIPGGAEGALALTSDIPSAAIESNSVNIASNSAAIAGLTDTTSTLSADKADRSELAGYATPADVYRIVAGTNVVLVVTNYNSTVHAPSMKLQHLDPETGEYVTYWDETRGHANTLTNAMNYADDLAAALDAAKAPRAWSRVTSGLGADAPEGTTYISTPVTHISGGFEFEKKITAGGTVWTLCSTSLAAGSTTNGFFEISALDGTPVFSVEKTDSVLVGVDASAIDVVGSACVISVPAVADTHPFARVATTLVQPTWYKEDSDGMPAGSPASVTWSGSSGAWVATVDFGSSPQGFVFFEYLQEGRVKIVNSAVVDLSQGVHYGGATYMPTVSGNELKFIRQ